MTLNYDNSRSSKVIGQFANRNFIGDFLYDLLFDFYWPQHRMCQHFWSIWHV